MNTTLPFLDGLDYIGRYSWFGIFREENANAWTGSGVSLLDNSGDLTELGAIYLGPPFTQGLSAGSGSAEGAAAHGGGKTWSTSWLSLISLIVGIIL